MLTEDTLYIYFKKISKDFLTRPAIIFSEKNKSISIVQYGELLEQIDSCADRLIDLNLNDTKDPIALLAPSDIEWIILTFAAAKINQPLVYLKTSVLNQLNYSLTKTKPKALIVHQDYLPYIYNIWTQKDCFPLPVILLQQLIDLKANTKRTSTNNTIKNQSKNSHVPLWYCFSSGTINQPKAIVLSHFNIVNNAIAMGNAAAYHKPSREGIDQHRICSLFPYFTAGGMIVGVLAPLFNGACIVCPGKKFNPYYLIQLIEKTQITGLIGPPALLEILTKEKIKSQLKSSKHLQFFMVGSASCSKQLYNFIKHNLSDTPVVMMSVYGQTEAGVITHIGKFIDDLPEDDSYIEVPVGYPLSYLQAKIVDINKNGIPLLDKLVAPNERGMLIIHSPSIMEYGYFNEPNKTNQVIQNGWLITGDIATITKEDLFYVHGRVQDLFFQSNDESNKKILPSDIESVLLYPTLQTGIEDIQVVSWQNTTGQLEIGASIKANVELNIPAIYHEIKKRCEKFKLPLVKYLEVLPEYPLNASSKIDRANIAAAMQEKLKKGNLFF